MHNKKLTHKRLAAALTLAIGGISLTTAYYIYSPQDEKRITPPYVTEDNLRRTESGDINRISTDFVDNTNSSIQRPNLTATSKMVTSESMSRRQNSILNIDSLVSESTQDRQNVERTPSVRTEIVNNRIKLASESPYDRQDVETAPSTTVEIVDNKVKLVSEEPISTFSADADDGSYKLLKSQVNYGRLLDEDFIRAEEFINAFTYEYERPNDLNIPFATNINITPSPWSDNYLLKIGIKGYEYKLADLPPVNLTFLVDVSGSMRGQIGTIQAGLKMLVNKLRDEDRISLVTYAGSTQVVLSNTMIENKNDILQAISNLKSGGSTNGGSGINLAYAENERHFIENGVNRIILMSDGDFNVGLRGVKSLEELVEEKRKSGVTFSTVGIGGSNYQDQQMERMANKGNGTYTFLGDMNDARSVFADRFISTIKNIAKDLKYQIEFNPVNVKEYRLIGYENRMLETQDFNNDNVDAGEIPSGATTTAIYEITLNGQQGLFPESRYANNKSTSVSLDFKDELAFLKIRYKQPNEDKSELLTFDVSKSLLDEESNSESEFAIHVAGFAQLYRNNEFINADYTYETIIDSLTKLNLSGERQGFLELVKTTSELKSIQKVKSDE